MIDWHNIRALQALHLHEVPPGKPFNLDLISDQRDLEIHNLRHTQAVEGCVKLVTEENKTYVI